MLEDDSDEWIAEHRESRRDYLVASIESSGVGSAEHLRSLNLQQLEDMYRMQMSYDEKLCQASSNDDDSNSFPLEALWQLMESEKLWFPFSCFSYYDTDSAQK